ncbi:YCII-related protein [Kribbella flavida DSM 17836]|uniref:YCII-related protein n=1 Tax=Kribbella flavida (strain DSM 17836 / JCM 10339 / NBRC 14399) TaxID=479435 RepID=D2Q497_KRIFD|nr:YciI family protein [Kribbella flavida]ADB30411.1 YCII-related protein [Kribbella flavida DSM 17836]
MKYVLLIHSNPQTWGHPSFLRTKEAQALPRSARDALTEQLEKLLAELTETGELVAAEPLAAPARTKVVRIRQGVRATTDGPYSEAKEQLAGVFIVDVATPERAEEIAARIPEAHFAAIELRPIEA